MPYFKRHISSPVEIHQTVTMQLKVSEVVEGHVSRMEMMKKEHDAELLEVVQRKNVEIKQLKKLIQVVMIMMPAYIITSLYYLWLLFTIFVLNLVLPFFFQELTLQQRSYLWFSNNSFYRISSIILARIAKIRKKRWRLKGENSKRGLKTSSRSWKRTSKSSAMTCWLLWKVTIGRGFMGVCLNTENINRLLPATQMHANV